MRQIKSGHNKRSAIVITGIAVVLVLLCVGVIYARTVYLQKLRDNMQEQIEIIFTDLNSIKEKIIEVEKYIEFSSVIEEAKVKVGETDYETALSLYEDALLKAKTLSFIDGIDIAEKGIENVQTLIVEAKRREALRLVNDGDLYYYAGMYDIAIDTYYEAMALYREIGDHMNALQIVDLIDLVIKMQNEELTEPPSDPTGLDNPGTSENPDEPESNYEFNKQLHFDLQTMIDNQNRRPANQVRMGSADGMNEGWYNGCGWVAVYNALIRLGDPKHPAEIVRYFEEIGGTVLDGVFGTHPNAIESYFKNLGYNVRHSLFPQLTANIDEVIKTSHVGILAYAHVNAAHYVMIEYNEDLNGFIIYNDRYARTMSEALNLNNKTDSGALIDSVTTFISETADILFSFSLIIVF